MMNATNLHGALKMAPPFVTAWSGESGFLVRPEPLLDGAPAVFCRTGRLGDGAPLWGRMSEERQRRCVLHRLCQICGQRCGALAYAVAILPTSARKALPMRLHEPLVCARCISSAFLCPRVRRAFLEDCLLVVAVGRYVAAPIVFGVQPTATDETTVAVNRALRNSGHETAVGFVEMFIDHGWVVPRAKLGLLLDTEVRP